jgi:hypothetical protein
LAIECVKACVGLSSESSASGGRGTDVLGGLVGIGTGGVAARSIVARGVAARGVVFGLVVARCTGSRSVITWSGVVTIARRLRLISVVNLGRSSRGVQSRSAGRVVIFGGAVVLGWTVVLARVVSSSAGQRGRMRATLG